MQKLLFRSTISIPSSLTCATVVKGRLRRALFRARTSCGPVAEVANPPTAGMPPSTSNSIPHSHVSVGHTGSNKSGGANEGEMAHCAHAPALSNARQSSTAEQLSPSFSLALITISIPLADASTNSFPDLSRGVCVKHSAPNAVPLYSSSACFLSSLHLSLCFLVFSPFPPLPILSPFPSHPPAHQRGGALHV